MKEDELYHIGTPHEGATPHSGRYPFGSGENPFQRASNFYGLVMGMKARGMSEEDIRKSFKMSKDEYVQQKSLLKMENREIERLENQKLIDQGYTNRSERARLLSEKMGYPISESTLRLRESDTAISKDERRRATADVLRQEVEEHGMIDVGKGTASILGISETRLKTAVKQLENEGYNVYPLNQQNMSNPAMSMPMQILCKKDIDQRYMYQHKTDIGVINARFESPDGVGLLGLKKPEKVSSNRVEIVYGEKGEAKDGIIELRPGIADLDLKDAAYAQVRINIDDTHYIKGVAIYADDLPPGKDIRFNTNKAEGTPMMGDKWNSVLKELKTIKDPVTGEDTGKVDWDNPFGAAIKKGGQRGALNIVNEESDWRDWSKSLSSQFLSKQSVTLAKRQLDLAAKEKFEQYEEISNLTNPIVKQNLLMKFGDECDTAAVHLKAAAMPHQSTAVLIPVNSLKPTEVYAPNYGNGTRVCLIRYPHGGTFEIPQLTVNNNNKEGKKILGQTADAVGIHHSVAQQLSGADFDGDTVVVIPNNSGDIKARKALEGLQDFNPKIYKLPDNAPGITEDFKQKQMGIVSNLITDMTIQGAPPEHIVRAVKHSMVVIDSEKHHLDYKQSAKDQNIDELKRLYQRHYDKDGNITYGGASTIISRAGSEERVNQRKPGRYYIDSATGKKTYPDWAETGDSYIDKKGKEIKKTTSSTKMAETQDARTLLSIANGGKGMPMEQAYAEYANTMKALGNQARKEALKVDVGKKDPVAAKEYATEVKSIMAKYADADAWSPKERHAHIYAESVVKTKVQQNPDIDKEHKKRIRVQALQAGREHLGGKSPKIDLTEREWEAIQKKALSPTKTEAVIKKMNPDTVKQLAMPKKQKGLTAAQLATVKALIASGHSYSDVAKRYGVSMTTIQRAVKG